MYTFQRPGVPREAWLTRSRIASTPLFDAASTSVTSRDVPRVISVQLVHVPHGSPPSGRSQFRAFARMRADEVFPQPRGPENR